MKLLITAFEPFGGETVNPSMNLLAQLPEAIMGHDLIKCLLPVTFVESKRLLEAQILAHQPQIILSLGQAGGRAAISLEQVAINLNEAAIADNAGYQPKDLPIEVDGPDGLFTTLPIKAMCQASRLVGVPTAISYTAGTYVCNHIMYTALHTIRKHQLSAKAGFIHIPYESSQVLDKPAQPSMPLELMLKGIMAMLEELITPQYSPSELAAVAGTTH